MQGIDFIRLIHRYTSHQICIASYANSDNRKGGKPAEVLGRSPEFIEKWIGQFDRPGFGTYFTMGSCEKVGEHRRAKQCIRELACVWCELDFKQIKESISVAVRELLTLTSPPSLIVHSGHGLHCYWLLTEAVDAQLHLETLEHLMRTIASKLAGDKCWNIDRVLRVPGTTNSKGGETREVKVVENSGREYDLDGLIETFSEQRPVLEYRDGKGPAAEEDDNVWTRYAREHAAASPLDVDAALAAMAPGNIHNTLRDVSASLVSRGEDISAIVERLTAASQAACAGSKYFNVARERRKIERLCEGWQRKLSQKPEALGAAPATAVSGGNVIKLTRKTAPPPSSGPPAMSLASVSARPDVIRALAKGALEVWEKGGRKLFSHKGDMQVYTDGCWQAMTRGDEMRLKSIIQRGAEVMRQEPKVALLNAVWKYLMEMPELQGTGEVTWNAPEYLNCSNGVLNLRDGTFGAHDPAYHMRYRLAIPYQADADCPKLKTVLDRTFAGYPDRAEIIGVLQEFFGYSLFPASFAKGARRALFLYGPADTGKTLLAMIHRAMLGEDRVGSPSATQLGEKFGLSSLIDKVAWSRDEAVGEGDHLDAAIFKALVSGEQLTVRRMHTSSLSCRLDLSVCLTMNSLPWSREATRAMAVRLIVLRLRNVISAEERVKVLGELGLPGPDLAADLIAVEGAGILNWALAGMRRLAERGGYALPPSLDGELESFSETTNPAREWCETCLVEDPNTRVSKADMCHSYNAWFADQQARGHRAVSTKALMGMLRGILIEMREVRPAHNGPRSIDGWRLTSAGVRYWRQAMVEMKRNVGIDESPNKMVGENEGDEDDAGALL